LRNSIADCHATHYESVIYWQAQRNLEVNIISVDTSVGVRDDVSVFNQHCFDILSWPIEALFVSRCQFSSSH
jgi:hypothetical protein